jgi:hypothetical protein
MANETKFTPGPWMFAEGNHRVFTPDGSDDVAFATASFERGRTYGEMVANARLIAAAPDLYAALDDIIAEVLRYYKNGGAIEPLGKACAKAAIALRRARREG